MQYPYLLGKWVDPIVGLSIGVAAYYLQEKRVQRPHGHTLNELLIRRFGKVTD